MVRVLPPYLHTCIKQRSALTTVCSLQRPLNAASSPEKVAPEKRRRVNISYSTQCSLQGVMKATSTARYHRYVQDITGTFKISQVCPRYHRYVQDITCMFRISQVCSGYIKYVQDITGMLMIYQVCSRYHRYFQGVTGMLEHHRNIQYITGM